MPTESSKTKEARRHYNEVKTLRNKLGAKARGKAKNSPIYKDYKTVDREYKAAGRQLGKMTKLKPRR